MRIIGGQYRGFRLHLPPEATTRPISDRAKEGLFNMLGDITGLSFVDAYAGSGSVGLEALSRGAGPVVFIESDNTATECIRINYRLLSSESQPELITLPVAVWAHAQQHQYDIVWADPPFDTIADAPLATLAQCASRLFIYKHPKYATPVELPGYELVKSRRYGSSAISIYRP